MSTTHKKKPGTIAVVGAGPGDPALVTVHAADQLAAADVVALDRPALDAFGAYCRADVELIDTGGPDLAKTLAARARDGRQVVWLIAGDPLSSAEGVAAVEAAARAKVPFEVVPGLHPGLAVPAFAGVPLTGRRIHGVRIIDAAAAPDYATLAPTGETVVVVGVGGALGDLAAGLIRAGHPAQGAVSVTWNGSTTRQRTVVATLATLATVGVDGKGTEPDAVVVVGPTVAAHEKLSWFEGKPLFGWKVLVPRTKEQAGALADQLRSYGAVPFEVPTIAVEPPRTPQAMDRAVKGLVTGRYQWVAFTSTNAVRAVREKFEELGLDARAMGGIKVACVGEQTGRSVLDWGIRPDLVSSGEQTSEGLLADWPDHDDLLDPLDRVLLPRADIATDTLLAGLKERGWEVDDVTAYRTVRAAPPPADVRDAIKTGGFDAVLFTSSSTVRNLVGIAGKPHPSSVIAVIGPQTKKTAEEFGLRVDVIAATPSAAVLAEALADFGAERRLAHETEPPGKGNRSRKAR